MPTATATAGRVQAAARRRARRETTPRDHASGNVIVVRVVGWNYFWFAHVMPYVCSAVRWISLQFEPIQGSALTQVPKGLFGCLNLAIPRIAVKFTRSAKC